MIGLLPFYLPVWLWRQGLELAGLSLLIAVSGLAFAAALAPWTRQARRGSTRVSVATSFALEILLVAFVVLLPPGAPAEHPLVVALVLGAANGFYNAWFWTTQRLLFASRLGENDAGRRYGNFQIYVAVLLKLGLVAGGLLLEAGGLVALLVLSTCVSGACAAWLWPRLPATPLAAVPRANPVATVPSRDATGARPVFVVDGVFLFLESHFWTISLFLVLDEDYARLGVLVVVLGIVFGGLFWLARGAVDRVRPAAVYRLAVALYALSWALRAGTDAVADSPWLGPLLIAITFSSSFFRLSFNKRFFEHARAGGDLAGYLVWKSRLSQTALGVAFAGAALALSLGPGDPARLLQGVYLLAAVAAFVYLAWGPARRPA